MLSEQVQKRERQKLERTKKQKAYIDMITYPLEYVVRPILNQFMDIDRKKVFLNHVTARQAPDYSLVIKQKMCFTEIYQKLSMHKYTTLEQFKHDVSLIWKNSMDYNKVDTPYYKVANKLKVASEKLFAIAEEKMSRYQLIDGIWDVPVDESIFDYKLIVEEEEDIEIAVDVKEQQVPKEKAIVEKREPKYRRNKKDYKANPATRNKLRTRTNSTVALESPPQKQKPTIESTTSEEAHVQSLTIIQGEQPAAAADYLRQTSITSYFAEQQRKEQKRKEERERKRLAEEKETEEKKRKEEQEELEKQQAQVSPPAEIICFDIETMQPIVPPTKPLTPPTMIDQPTIINTIMSNSTIMQPVVQGQQQSFVQPPISELLEDYSMDEIPNMIFDASIREASQLDEYTTIQEAFKVDPLEPDNSSNALFTEIPPIESNNDKNKRPVAKDRSNNDNNSSRKRKRSTRLTRSDGLQASIEELTKRPKISQEARSLFASYNGVSHLEKPVEVYKENRKISAPVGWVYVQENEEEKEQQAEAVVGQEEEKTAELTEKELKSLKKQRNKIPVPNFKRGEIVWAQVTGYPSHPAKFINLPDDQCSAKILASRRYNGDILVEFLCVPENHKW